MLFHLVAAGFDELTCDLFDIQVVQYDSRKPDADPKSNVYQYNKNMGNGIGFFESAVCIQADDDMVPPIFQVSPADNEGLGVWEVFSKTEIKHKDYIYHRCFVLRYGLFAKETKIPRAPLGLGEDLKTSFNYNMEECPNHVEFAEFKFIVGNAFH